MGWVSAIVGYVVFGVSAYRALTSSVDDSTIDTPWYVPQDVEDWINAEAARIQQEQKAKAEQALMKSFGLGALAALGTGLALGAFTSSRLPARRSR